ncbi:MAG: hypothetical protein VX726_12025 [Planctomycetota bacterium]|nr:hypothetical protein [Planctomycetota bacterium]
MATHLHRRIAAVAGPTVLSLAAVVAAETTVDDDALSRALRRPGGASWLSFGDSPATAVSWSPGNLPLRIAGAIAESPELDRIDRMRASIALEGTGEPIGRPDDVFGLRATIDGDGTAGGAIDAILRMEPSYSIYHGLRIDPTTELRSTIGWRGDAGRSRHEPWFGVGLRFEF